MKAILIFFAVNLYICGVIVTVIINKLRTYNRNKQKYKQSPSSWYNHYDCFGNWATSIFAWPLILIVIVVEMATDKLIGK